MQVFELKSISRSSNKKSDGSYKVFERELGVFDSLEKAEDFMRQFIDKMRECKLHSEYHCFVIYEKPLNGKISQRWDSVCEFDGIRSYLPDGTLYCDSPYDDDGEKQFMGRAAENIKLKVDDIAWYLDYDHIRPCLVASLPVTDMEFQKIARKNGKEKLGWDYSDDSYRVYTCDRGHQHPECWRCMPYYGRISKRTLQRLYACKRHEEMD